MKYFALLGLIFIIIASGCVDPKYQDPSYCESDEECKVIGACCGKNVVNIYYEQKEFLVCPAVECLIPDRVIEIDAECRNNKCEGIINNERTCEEFKEFLDKIDFQEKEYTYSDIFNQGVNRIKERFPEFECQSVAA